MPPSGKKSIIIPMASSARGLKEELGKIAKRRAVSVSKIVEQIFAYAVGNAGSFPTQIDNPRPKPGKVISTTVSTQLADALTTWAKKLGRSRAAHCCFILECVIADQKLQGKIFN